MNSFVEFLRAAKSPIGKLIRIEGLVVMTAIILLLMSILDSFRRQSRSSVLKHLLLILDTVSASTVAYTTGLIQNVSLENQLLQVWVVLLITLKESVDYISVCGVEEVQDRRRRELRDLMESFWVAYLNATRGTKFKYPLWILWGLNISKILHRVISYEHASRSYGIGKNPMLVANYMKYEDRLTDPNRVDPVSMSGYKYLVMGEDKQKVEPEIPGYLMKLAITHDDKFITLDKIWQCEGRLLSSKGRDRDGKMKDLCLSFALYKLLRVRFDELHLLPRSHYSKNRELVLQGLMSDNNDIDRPFRVIEVELAFLTDYFYNRFPIIFSKGLPIFDMVRVIMMGATAWLAATVLVDYKPRNDDLRHIEHDVDVGKVITFVLLIVLIVKEAWEIITYIFSNWAKVVLICKYVEKPKCQKFVVWEWLLGFICRCHVTRPWHGKIGQFSLLSSFDYKPWNLGHKLTWGLVAKKKQGTKRQNPIKLPDAVKRVIVCSLRSSLQSNSQQLTRGRALLERDSLKELTWAFELETNTSTILVWHIATSLCEIEMCRRYTTPTNKKDLLLSSFQTFLNKLQSFVTNFKSWWHPSPFYLKLQNLRGELRCHYEIAASLSRYCAYLIVSNQDMLSDPPAAEFIFDHTVLEAQNSMKGCKSMESRYLKLKEVKFPIHTLMEKGAMLGKYLMENIDSDEIRWKVLAELWAELVLYIAPTDRSSCHELALAKGGEFLTHLWALLSHAGILEQSEASQNI